MPTRRAVLRGSLALAAGAAWLPTMHLAFGADPTAGLLKRLIAPWERGDIHDVALERAANPEWDFMGRTFLVLALANHGLAHPDERDRMAAAIDRILADTLATEAQRGHAFFLLPYAHARPWRHDGRSLFVDGEIALALGARRLLQEDGRWTAAHQRRTRIVADQLDAGPIGSAESYPDECWSFCNGVALAGLRLADAADGGDHRRLTDRWLDQARRHLVDPDTGMLVSSFTWEGRHRDGPEGTSIFMAAHALQLIDPAFAEDQYARARDHLGRTLFGFGWAREWPDSWRGPMDVDSGPVIPVVDASPGASGLAVVGAAAFGDTPFRDALVRSLGLAAFPVRDEEGLRYAASNRVGDAMLLYALTLGPLWQAADRRLS